MAKQYYLNDVPGYDDRVATGVDLTLDEITDYGKKLTKIKQDDINKEQTGEDYRPGTKNNINNTTVIKVPVASTAVSTSTTNSSTFDATTGPTTSEEIDPITALKQRILPADDPKMQLQLQIDQAKQMPDKGESLKKIATTITSGGTNIAETNYVPPVSPFLSSKIGNSQPTQLTELNNTLSSINNLVHFTSMDTAAVRYFVQHLNASSAGNTLNHLPYFKPLSESIGSSMTFLTDASALGNTSWIQNAASNLGQISPISKLNRHKIHPGVLANIDAANQNLIQSTQLNLGLLQSQIAGYISQFSHLLGLLPKEVTQLLAPILSPVLGAVGQGQNFINQGQNFINQIFSAYSKLATSSHGLDMIVDIAHLQRVHDNQSQMLSSLTNQFGDQLRMLETIHPVKGFVKVQNSIFESSIHGYPAVVNLLGDKIITARYTNDVLKAIGTTT